jgi:Polyketide cyclase / dehydrase and lipid transport
MASFQVTIDTNAEPEQVLDALLDFSDRRPEIWPGLAREHYEVYEVGQTSALIKEGSPRPLGVWAIERYDWSTPGTVRWTVEQSNFCTPGSHVEARVAPGPGGGSRIALTWDRTGANRRGRLIVALMTVVGPPMLRSYLRKPLDRLARQPVTR